MTKPTDIQKNNRQSRTKTHSKTIVQNRYNNNLQQHKTIIGPNTISLTPYIHTTLTIICYLVCCAAAALHNLLQCIDSPNTLSLITPIPIHQHCERAILPLYSYITSKNAATPVLADWSGAKVCCYIISSLASQNLYRCSLIIFHNHNNPSSYTQPNN